VWTKGSDEDFQGRALALPFLFVFLRAQKPDQAAV
jgi:hypothetical protein